MCHGDVFFFFLNINCLTLLSSGSGGGADPEEAWAGEFLPDEQGLRVCEPQLSQQIHKIPAIHRVFHHLGLHLLAMINQSRALCSSIAPPTSRGRLCTYRIHTRSPFAYSIIKTWIVLLKVKNKEWRIPDGS